jgi:hypothetical protein
MSAINLAILQESVIGEGKILSPVGKILRRRQSGQIPRNPNLSNIEDTKNETLQEN